MCSTNYKTWPKQAQVIVTNTWKVATESNEPITLVSTAHEKIQ